MFNFFLILNSIAFLGGQVARINLPNGVAITFLDISVGLTVGIWLLGKIHKKEKISGYLLNGILIFVIAGIASLLANSWNYTPKELGIATLYLCRFLIYAGLYFVVRGELTKRKGEIRQSMFIVGCVSVFIGFLQYIFYPDLRGWYFLGWDEHLFRMFGTFLDPNYFGSFLVIFLLFIFQLKKEAIKIKDIKIIALIITIVVAILLTYSRSAVVMGMAAIVTYFLMKKDFVKMAVLALIFLSSVFLVSNYYIEGLNPFRIASTQARIESAQNAIEIIKDHPIIGVGFNTYRYAQNEYGFRDSPFWMTSHADAGTDNSFLFILATTGIIGFISYAFLIRRMFSMTKFLQKQQREIFLTMIITLLVGSIFNNLLFYTPLMMWLWIYLGATESN